MTVSSTATRASYTGNAVTTAFSAPFAYLTTGEVKVYLDGVLQSTGYTVSAAPASSGTVTFSSAPGAGVKVVITRATAKTQNIDYVANDAFAADVTEGGFDRAMLAAQDNAAAIGRSLRVADHLPAIDPIADPDDVVLAWASGAILAVAYGVTADGATDDTAALVLAINAAVSAGKELWLPAGTMVIDQITLPASVTIKGQGRTKTILKRKASSANSFLLFAYGLSDLRLEGFSVDGNNAAQTVTGTGIQLTNCTRPVLKNVGAYSWKRNNAGAGLAILNGSGVIIDGACYFNDNYDGCVLSGHADGTDLGATYTANLRNGLLVASASHRFRNQFVRASGNCLSFAGAGVQIIDSDDCAGFAPVANSNTLGHGYQHNNSDRGKVYYATAGSNGISGVDLYASDDGELHGVYCVSNASRGVEVDSASSRMKIFGGRCTGNTDMDWSIFSSDDTELLGVIGNVRIAGGTSNRTQIFGGGQGYALTVTSGQAANVQLYGWRGSVSDTGGHISFALGCPSYVAANSGSATITSAATSVVVTHGLARTPSAFGIKIVPTNSPTTDPGNAWISNITSSQFTINCRTAPGASTATFDWTASLFAT